MNKKQNKHFSYLQSFRKRRGLSLQDMAFIIGIDTGNLSKIETGKRTPSLMVALSYHAILDIPIETFFKNNFGDILNYCLRNALILKDKCVGELSTPKIDERIMLLDAIIDSLIDQEKKYGA